jgi:glycerol-3-phosphate acyltransferase PlsY
VGVGSLGTFNTGYILGKLIKKVDIRESGSNNAGASNATIVLGWKYGIITALSDILKATLAVYITKMIFQQNDFYMFTAGLGVILGHDYPFYIGFKGGKGTASVIGMFIAIDIKIALFMALGIILITIITNYIAIGTFAMYMINILLVFREFSLISFCISILLAVLGIYKHRHNYVNIMKKEEIGLRQVVRKNS